MRESRQSSVMSASQKIKYPRCERKKEHTKESLNFICLSPQCKQRGLICLQCKSSGEHQGHNIQPVRTFLTKLEESLKRVQLNRSPKIQENASQVTHINERTVLQKLQEQHLELLSLMKLQIEEISEKVRICEQEVLKQFNRAREKIYTQYEKEVIINKTLTQIQRYFSQADESVDLKFSFSKLLALLKIEKQDISVTNEADSQLNAYVLAAKTFKNNILVWQRETSNILTDIFKTKPQYQVRQHSQRPTTAIDLPKNSAMTFSLQLKTDSITLDKEAKIAKVKDDKNGKIILLNPSVLESKNGSVKLKVLNQSVSSVMHIGVCLKSIVSQKNYKFQKSSHLHGLFGFSSNGFIYSHNLPNPSKGLLAFKTGDELSLEVDFKERKVIIKKKNDGKTAEVSFKHINELDQKDLYFCVSLGGSGDKVQILG